MNEKYGYSLSICITTRNRCRLLLETISSALPQIDDTVEIVIVDGASNDDTSVIISDLAHHDHRIRYFREEHNGGIDRDYDKAVTYATGDYCWLMSDDDLFLPNSIRRVLNAIKHHPSLIIVDAEIRDIQLSTILATHRLNLETDLIFKASETEKLFITTCDHLSFIGAVIINRNLWIKRNRDSYFDSYFVHIGVIFQEPLPSDTLVLKKPCLAIRYGNASWSPKTFEIWMVKWPQLIWSLPTISDKAKNSIVKNPPYSLRKLLLMRSKGSYSLIEYKKWISHTTLHSTKKILYTIIALTPGKLANLIAIVYVLFFSKARKMALTTLNDSPYSLLKKKYGDL